VTGRFKAIMISLYAVGLSAVAAFFWFGHTYYALPLVERPRSDLHALFKPGGMVGHTLGVVGSCMLLLLFLYSARKRRTLGLRRGKLSNWLHVHIWFGIMGPLLVTLHSSFKFHGIVSVSYYSMMAVMVSGFVGRYIYIQIPRDETGSALSMQEIDARIEAMRARLIDHHRLNPELVAALAPSLAGGGGGAWGLLDVFRRDLLRPVHNRRVRRLIRSKHPELSGSVAREVLAVSRQQALLLQRRATLRHMNAVFHYWHVIHKPFAWVMILIMIVHVTVVVLMGYTWIF